MGDELINEDCLGETSFTGTPVKGALMLNWVCFYFGEPLVCDELREDKCMLAFESLGQGYRSWANAVVQGQNDLQDICSVLVEVETKSRLTVYFGSACSDDKELPQAGRHSLADNGRIGTITTVCSSQYPDEAEHTKAFFLPVAPPAALAPEAAAPSQTIVVRPASNDGKDVEAKQGQAKLALFQYWCHA